MPNLFELRRFPIFFLQPTGEEQKMGDLKKAALHDANWRLSLLVVKFDEFSSVSVMFKGILVGICPLVIWSLIRLKFIVLPESSGREIGIEFDAKARGLVLIRPFEFPPEPLPLPRTKNVIRPLTVTPSVLHTDHNLCAVLNPNYAEIGCHGNRRNGNSQKQGWYC